MKFKKIISAALSCVMLVPGMAQASGSVSYVSDGLDVSIPYAGSLETNVDVPEGGRLITAVYDNASGSLIEAALSDEGSLATTVNIDTLSGRTVRNFVIDSLGNLKPCTLPAEKSLVLRADMDSVYGRTILSWSKMRDFDAAEYIVEKDGTALATVSADRYSYIDYGTPSADSVYSVKAVNAKGDTVSVSSGVNAASDINTFDPSAELTVVISPSSLGYVTYSGDNRQVAVIGRASDLDKDTQVGISADYAWTTDEIGGRPCIYTHWYYAGESSTAQKRGNIYLDLGSDFDKEASITRLTFDYYDTGSGSMRVRYVNGVDEDGAATHNYVTINYTGEGWKTASLDISDAYFNKAADSKLQRYGDIRFETVGTIGVDMSPVYIGNITVDNTFDGRAEYIAAADNTVTELSSGVERSSGSLMSLLGAETLAETIGEDGAVSYTSTSGTDTAFRFVEDIDGKSAVMSAKFTNSSGTAKTGNLAFALNPDVFVPDEKSYIIEVDYNSKYAEPSVNYVTRVTASADDAGVVSYKFTYNTKDADEIKGDGVWKTAVFNISDATFNYDANGKYSAFYNGKPVFRMLCPEPLYVNAVRIATPAAVSGTAYTDDINVVFGDEGQVPGGVSVYDVQKDTLVTSDNVMTYVQAGPDNAWAVSSKSYQDGNSSRKTYIYFRVDDSYIYGDRDPYVEIEVTYLDVSGNNMNLQYHAADGARTLSTRQTATGDWKTAKFILKDAYFVNQMNNQTDFRFCLNTDSADYQMIIKEVKVRNIGCATEENALTPKIYLAGDSTCEPYYTTAAGVPREGWGMELGGVFDDEVEIVNKAKGGKSSRSYLNDRDISGSVNNPDNRWAEILRNGKPGDYLFIQFGHNDRSGEERSTDPASTELSEESYRYNLKRFVVAAREQGMIPVFLTSIWVRDFAEDGTLADTTVEPYRQAMREVGAAYSVPVLDVGAVHKELVERLGEEASKQIFCHVSEEEYPDFSQSREDNTHINKTGAIEVCKIIANEIKRVAQENDEIARLAEYLDDTADLEYIG